MAKKKAIDCPEVLGGCGKICVEVGRGPLGYPKQSQGTRPINVGKPSQREVSGSEYRYVCPYGSKEWLHDTLHREISLIEDPTFNIRLIAGKEMYETKDPVAIKHWNLKPGKLYTKEELKEAFKKGSKGKDRRSRQMSGKIRQREHRRENQRKSERI